MTYVVRPSSTLLMLIVLSAALHAQQDSTWNLRVGIGAGHEWGTGIIDFKSYPRYSMFSDCTTRESEGYLEAELSDLWAFSGFTATSRITFRRTDLASNVRLEDALVLLPGSSEPTVQKIEQNLAMRLNTVEWAILPGWRFPFGLRLHLGPSFGLRRVTSVGNTTSLVGMPDGVRFVNTGGLKELDSGRTLVLDDGTILPIRSTRFALGVLLAAAYDIHLSSRFSVVPEVRLRGDFLSPVTDTRWQILSPGVSLSLAYTFGRSGHEETQPDESLGSVVPLRASIDLYSLDEDGTRQEQGTMRSRTIARTERTWMSGTVHFENGSPEIPPFYRTPLPTVSPSSLLDSLSRLPPIDAYPAMLDIVGAQLRLRPALSVMLAPGSATSDVGRCAARLRDYLVERWDIDSSRITMSAKRPGQDTMESGRYVQLLLDATPFPVRLERSWLQQQYDVSRIMVAPSVETGVGVKEWAIDVRRNGTVIARQTSDDVSGDRIDLGMLLATTDSNTPTPLEADLVVTDSAGVSATARDTLALTMRDGDTVKRGAIDIWNILGGNEGDLNAALTEIALSIPADASVTIAPLASASTRREPELVHRVASTLAALIPDNTITTVGRPESPETTTEHERMTPFPIGPCVRITAER